MFTHTLPNEECYFQNGKQQQVIVIFMVELRINSKEVSYYPLQKLPNTKH
jgi:hypothetical protein